jgi:hypothetical protein
LVAEDPSCTALIKPAVQGEDLRPWYQEEEGRWLIVLPCGWTQAEFGVGISEEEGWEQLSARHCALAEHLRPFTAAARRRSDKGDYWWELRACGYYEEFDEPKIFWPDICKLPRFSWDDSRRYIGNTGYIASRVNPTLLGILQSRVFWFVVSQVCQPLRLRAGLWQYRLLPQFMARLPVPAVSTFDDADIGMLAMEITKQARTRYKLHCKTRRR